ncbi:TPA: mechanosensitive ion channel family protein [Candidatus Daviesbacteria bacterium]|nr:MAG: potassium transporter KefA [Candidatus Daviesbacteria bacterium RIFCSPHIGHO2_02_FULL_39_41]OGE44697.1 MAG: potassium transporter KefA [Candidatus Daviesbacteria bacterium RIFCSPHIGHO2_12_FULL_38_25]OGE68910.1 MAG: potassium transporter KefA [Candidatus Daviesbacteria bacterium RIFCSPLOWO2_02_FULL_38_18]OGE73419.1 MAG: potassium transporter KefA [Candidatus Daviesbacteria bacterium RIFCSPLOWO2_12_FULL_38_10]HBQ50431.1 mechanosensitive ion channel family protein [Candidatus Daviesbacteria
MELLKYLPDNILSWFFDHGLKILLILVGTFVVHKFSFILIDKGIRKAVTTDRFISIEAEKKRQETLITVFHQAIVIIVWLLAVLMILSEIGINTAPLIAGAGIIGLAFGFGGQYLIKDLISGFFIILENQYRVGDVACFGDTCGLVEKVTLRTTILRDLDGVVHHVPNGEIKTASNLSKYFARVNLNIGVSYNSDLEKVIKVVNNVGKELAKDKNWKEMIIKAPQFLRVDDFADSAIVIKILGETKPLKQWDVSGELRKRLKIAFDKNGIEIPFPQRVIHQAE